MSTRHDDSQPQFARAAHPAKLVAVHFFRMHAASPPDVPDDADLTVKMGHRVLDHDDGSSMLRINAFISIGNHENAKVTPESNGFPKGPYFSVELSGLFEIDTTRMPIKEAAGWANQNGFLVLVPYLREAMYSIMHRCGLSKYHLPLLQIPTTIAAAKQPANDSTN